MGHALRAGLWRADRELNFRWLGEQLTVFRWRLISLHDSAGLSACGNWLPGSGNYILLGRYPHSDTAARMTYFAKSVAT